MSILKKLDAMSPSQRMNALISGQTPDRVPFSPSALGFAAKTARMDLGEFYRNPDKAYAAGIHLMETYPWMNTRPGYGWADRGAWEFGGQVIWPDKDRYAAPTTFAPVVDTPEQVAALPDPDPAGAGMTPLVARFNALSRSQGFPASLPGGTPTTLTASALGVNNFLRWIITHPDVIHDIQRKATNFIINSARITIRTHGAENCSVYSGVPMESNQLISGKMFDNFCKPYIEKIFEFYTRQGIGSAIVHLCGDHTINLSRWKDIPLPDRTIFSIGREMDIRTTAKLLGPDYIVAGNLDSAVLQVGSFEDVYEDVHRCLRSGKDLPGGFLLMPSCEFPMFTPHKNVLAIEQCLADNGFF